MVAMLFPLLAALAAVPAPVQEQAKAHFDMQLFDGQSARWRFEGQVPETELVCGYVNAKNRLGAYTGFQPFYFNPKDGTGRIFGPDEDPWLFRLVCLGEAPS